MRVTKFVIKLSYGKGKTLRQIVKTLRQILKIFSEPYNINIYARERSLAQSGGRRAKDNGKIFYFRKNVGAGVFFALSLIKYSFNCLHLQAVVFVY